MKGIMEIKQLVAQLKEERNKLSAAIAALEGLNHTGRKTANRKANSGRGAMSAEGKARIAKAQRARWKRWKAERNK
jgi:hypothetical protein